MVTAHAPGAAGSASTTRRFATDAAVFGSCSGPGTRPRGRPHGPAASSATAAPTEPPPRGHAASGHQPLVQTRDGAAPAPATSRKCRASAVGPASIDPAITHAEGPRGHLRSGRPGGRQARLRRSALPLAATLEQRTPGGALHPSSRRGRQARRVSCEPPPLLVDGGGRRSFSAMAIQLSLVHEAMRLSASVASLSRGPVTYGMTRCAASTPSPGYQRLQQQARSTPGAPPPPAPSPGTARSRPQATGRR